MSSKRRKFRVERTSVVEISEEKLLCNSTLCGEIPHFSGAFEIF
ncbi:MAG: hypothetical protein WCE57_09005 [Salegentibacter sp.]